MKKQTKTNKINPNGTMKVFNGLVKPNPVNIQDIPYVALDADEFAKLTGLSINSYMPIESSTVRAPEVREAILNAVGLYNILQSIYKGSFHCTYDPTLILGLSLTSSSLNWSR